MVKNCFVDHALAGSIALYFESFGREIGGAAKSRRKWHCGAAVGEFEIHLYRN
jgi:hypothetical protein